MDGKKAAVIAIAVIYVLSPIDFMPGIPVDDIVAVLISGIYALHKRE